MLEESSARSRRLDADSHHQSLEKLKQIEQKAVEDWMVKQQREINSTLQKHEMELNRVREELSEEYAGWEEKQSLQVSASGI
jgi:hypothetical protein